jgi:hypothetical protein
MIPAKPKFDACDIRDRMMADTSKVLSPCMREETSERGINPHIRFQGR